MDVPFRHPNCFGSISCFTSSMSHLTTKSSSTLDTHGVRAIGLRSLLPVTGVTFGIGDIYESFHSVGKQPEDSERLNISSSGTNSFQMRFGTPSGPCALKGLRLSNLLQTSVGLITGSCSGAGKKAGSELKFKGGRSVITEMKYLFKRVARVAPDMTLLALSSKLIGERLLDLPVILFIVLHHLCGSLDLRC